MGREISVFSDYRQRENSLTNHCGILFRLIYRESPQQFETLIVGLLPEQAQLRVGPLFTQQEKSVKTVPDLLIRQEAFSLYFETKIGDWFHQKQLQGHMDGLASSPGIKVLFCLSNFERDDPEVEFGALIEEAAKHNIIVQFVSFEQLLQQVRALRLSNPLAETVDEFEQYLDRNELLPRWRYLLDVVNCGESMDEIQAGAYVCPRSSPYTHARARFLGTYQNKVVPSVHEIDALVIASAGGNDIEVRWKNNTHQDALLVNRGREMLSRLNPMHLERLQTEGLQIFLLGAGAPTNFVKDSPGGLFGSRLYFWDIARQLQAETVEELAAKLRGRKWSEFDH